MTGQTVEPWTIFKTLEIRKKIAAKLRYNSMKTIYESGNLTVPNQSHWPDSVSYVFALIKVLKQKSLLLHHLCNWWLQPLDQISSLNMELGSETVLLISYFLLKTWHWQIKWCSHLSFTITWAMYYTTNNLF